MKGVNMVNLNDTLKMNICSMEECIKQDGLEIGVEI